ncbi:MAG: DUF952 domain-containing protein [Pseudomonadota bacterium]
MGTQKIYKIMTAGEWRSVRAAGVYRGSLDDWRDGYLHFSSAAQARKTAEKHFAGAADLRLVTVDAEALGEALKWEPSRGGDLFPHLYGDLPRSAILEVTALPLGEDGAHLFPDGFED